MDALVADRTPAPGQVSWLWLGGCGHWSRIHAPADVPQTGLGVCGQCKPGDPGVVGEQDGAAVVEVWLVRTPRRRARPAR